MDMPVDERTDEDIEAEIQRILAAWAHVWLMNGLHDGVDQKDATKS